MTTGNKKIISSLLLTSIVSLLILLFAHNIMAVLNNCFHAIDLGIYQQAIYELASGNGLNPYLTIRNLNIFNDHFDPIIFLAIPFVKIMNYHPISLILFELFWFIALILIVYRTCPLKRYRHEIILMILLSKGFISGIIYPIHPSTWSAVPIILLAYFIREKKPKAVILTLISLFLFKEAFPIAALFMAMGLFLQKEKKLALITALISAISIILIFKVRPLILGPIFDYGGVVIEEFIANPLTTLGNINFIPFIKIIYPFIIPLYFLIRKDPLLFKEPILWLAAPLIGLHLITNKVDSQYGSFLIAPIWGLILYHPQGLSFLKNKKAALISLTLFFLSSMGTYTKIFKFVIHSENKKCLISQEKSKSTKQLKKIIKNIANDKTILASGGLIPNILAPGKQIYQIGLFSKKLPSYDYLLLERNGSGDTFPYSAAIIEQVITQCDYHILMKNSFYFFAQGPINRECLQALEESIK